MRTGFIPPGTAAESLRTICDAFDLPLEVRTALETHLRLTVDATLERCAMIADVVAGGHVYDNGTDEAYHTAAHIAEQIRALNTRLSV